METIGYFITRHNDKQIIADTITKGCALSSARRSLRCLFRRKILASATDYTPDMLREKTNLLWSDNIFTCDGVTYAIHELLCDEKGQKLEEAVTDFCGVGLTPTHFIM